MDDKEFRKHLAALVHGHHHPEEHDWSSESKPPRAATRATPAESTARRSRRRVK